MIVPLLVRASLLAPLLLAPLAASPVRAVAQEVGRLSGTVTGGTAARPVTGATVALVRLEPESPAVSMEANPDTAGRYALSALPPGRYLVQLSSATLDSLDLALPAAELTVAPGQAVSADFALPSGSALRDATCPGLALGRHAAAVAGRARDADGDAPLAGATVVVSWTEITVDPRSLRATSDERAGEARTGPRGDYRLCGVPLGAWLTLQLQHEGRAGTAVRVSISADEGVMVRDLSLSARTAPTIAALDSTERLARLVGLDSVTGELLQTGTASVTGIVRGAGELPLANAQVRVRDARGSTITDADGRFVLGRLPEGTQILVVRQLGYALAELPVELRAGRRVTRDVRLVRAVSLDSVVVTAFATRYREFEFNRGMHIMGTFLTGDMIERRIRALRATGLAAETGDLVDRLPGFTVVGRGKVARVHTNGALMGRPPCETNVVVDGVEELGVNTLKPSQVAAIEAYAKAQGPRVYRRSDCGLVVIWSTAWRRPSRPAAVGDGVTTDVAP